MSVQLSDQDLIAAYGELKSVNRVGKRFRTCGKKILKRLKALGVVMNGAHGTIQDRFWKKVSIAGDNDCWLWNGYRNANGYGEISRGIRGLRAALAHRVSFEIRNGSIPDSMDVLHSCDNPRCVNPHHLWLGTHADNMRDMTLKQRRRYPKPRYGEDHPGHKLTAENVREIRGSSFSSIKLASRFGVSKKAILLIRHGRTWRSVQ